MEMEFSKSTVPCLRQILCRTSSHEQTQELRLGDGMPDAGKVLGCWGQLLARGKQWRDREIGISAGCTVWVLYAPEDDSPAQMIEGYLPLQMQWDLPEASDRGEIRLDMAIAGMDARIANPRKIVLRVQISARVQGVVPDHVASYTAKEVPEDVQLLQRTYPMTLLREVGEKIANPEQRFQLKGVEKVLSYGIAPWVTETKIASGRLLMKGVGRLQLLCQGTDGKLCSQQLELPFSQLADLETDTDADTAAAVTVCPSALEVELEEDGQLKVRADLVCQYAITQRQDITLPEDAYSNFRELETVVDKMKLPVILDSVLRETAVEIPWSEDGEVVDCGLWTAIPQAGKGEGERGCELKAIAQVLYYDREGQLVGKQLPWEQTQIIDAGDGCNICMGLTGVTPPTVNHGSIHGQLEWMGSCTALEEKRILSGLVLGKEKERSDARPSVILRRSGDQELWDLAKSCGSTVEAIRRVNQLEDGPMEDIMLLIPVM